MRFYGVLNPPQLIKTLYKESFQHFTFLSAQGRILKVQLSQMTHQFSILIGRFTVYSRLLVLLMSKL